jgi:hypothetical protein
MKQTISKIVTVVRQPTYAMITAVASLGFGLLHYVLSMSLLQSHFATVFEAMPAYLVASLGLSVAVAILAGLNVSLIVFKIKGSKLVNMKKSGGSTALGSAFAVFTPGCPACTTPLVVALAAVGGLAAFPLQGLELKLISVGALLFAIYWISRGLQQPSCCSMKENQK